MYKDECNPLPYQSYDIIEAEKPKIDMTVIKKKKEKPKVMGINFRKVEQGSSKHRNILSKPKKTVNFARESRESRESIDSEL